MKFLLWEKRFETGFPEIDDRHRNEFDFINRVHQSVVEEYPRDQIERYMQTLISEVEEHFENEEQLMKSRNYAKLEDHKKEHNRLLKELRDNYRKFMNKDDSAAYAILELIHTWFIRHLEGHDREFGEYLTTSPPSSN